MQRSSISGKMRATLKMLYEKKALFARLAEGKNDGCLRRIGIFAANNEKYMKLLNIIGAMIVCMLMIAGCNQRENSHGNGKLPNISMSEKSFFGDSTLVIKSSNMPNGYRVSIISNKNLILYHFERGDSISQYLTLHIFPYEAWRYEDSVGVYSLEIDIPVHKLDTITANCPDLFFMDMNFDGEEELVVKHQGYNRVYYACFNLVKGNRKSSCPWLLECDNEPPYHNIVGGDDRTPCYTCFDYKKKGIYIYETMGCCAHQETWAKYFEGDDFGNEAKVKVVKEKYYDLWADGTEHIKTYKMVDDSLKLVDNKILSH